MKRSFSFDLGPLKWSNSNNSHENAGKNYFCKLFVTLTTVFLLLVVILFFVVFVFLLVSAVIQTRKSHNDHQCN